jgi:flavin reductase (DIM6/NTAB) family NADH-FMN oxidoreductase RutF
MSIHDLGQSPVRCPAERPVPRSSAGDAPRRNTYVSNTMVSLQLGRGDRCVTTEATSPGSHVVIEPRILYFGTPVALLTSENENGTFNLAPMSSAWALNQVVVLGLGLNGQTGLNLGSRPELVINLPGPDMWRHVERLAALTGRNPVPQAKQDSFQFEPDKFAAAGLRPEPSAVVRPPRVASCPLQLEARAASSHVDATGEFLIVEAHVVRVHADQRVVVPGTDHVAPALWSPLIYNFRHYFSLGSQHGHSFCSETAAQHP